VQVCGISKGQVDLGDGFRLLALIFSPSPLEEGEEARSVERFTELKLTHPCVAGTCTCLSYLIFRLLTRPGSKKTMAVSRLLNKRARMDGREADWEVETPPSPGGPADRDRYTQFFKAF